MAKLSIYKYVRTVKGWRYCKAAFHPNGKIKPNAVVVSGVEERHTEERYFLNFNNQWIDVGLDALEAQRKRQLRHKQMEYERLSSRSLATSEISALMSAQNQATASHRFRWRRVREAQQGSACARYLLQ